MSHNHKHDHGHGHHHHHHHGVNPFPSLKFTAIFLTSVFALHAYEYLETHDFTAPEPEEHELCFNPAKNDPKLNETIKNYIEKGTRTTFKRTESTEPPLCYNVTIMPK